MTATLIDYEQIFFADFEFIASQASRPMWSAWPAEEPSGQTILCGAIRSATRRLIRPTIACVCLLRRQR